MRYSCLVVCLFCAATVWSADTPQTVTVTGPSSVAVTGFNKGDVVNVEVRLYSCNPYPKGNFSKWPLVLQTSTGDFNASIITGYSFTQDFTFRASASGVLTAAYLNDGNPVMDYLNCGYAPTLYYFSADVTATINPSGPQFFPPTAKAALKKLKASLALWGSDAGTASFFCTLKDLPQPPSDFCAVGNAGLAALADLNATALDSALASDRRQDPNFLQVAPPVVIAPPPLTPVPGKISASEAAGYNLLAANMGQQLALLRAVNTAEDRAQSASEAGAAQAEQLQVQAVERYSQLLAALYTAQPALMKSVEGSVVASDDPGVTVDPTAVGFFELFMGTNNFLHESPILPDLMNLQASSERIDQINELFVVQDVNAAAGSYPGLLARADAISAYQNAAGALIVPVAAVSMRLVNASGLRAQVQGSFTLGSASSGINPVSTSLGLQIGSYLASIPAGAFSRVSADNQWDFGGQHANANYTFSGNIDGVWLEVHVTYAGRNEFEFTASEIGANVAPTSGGAVRMSFAIGRDGGSTQLASIR